MNNSTDDRPTANHAPRFALGNVVATPGALHLMAEHGVNPLSLIARHVKGDWGECCAEDAYSNEQALVHGSRVMSVYSLPPLKKVGALLNSKSDADRASLIARIWIITEADRSVTTLLLPEEY